MLTHIKLRYDPYKKTKLKQAFQNKCAIKLPCLKWRRKVSFRFTACMIIACVCNVCTVIRLGMGTYRHKPINIKCNTPSLIEL